MGWYKLAASRMHVHADPFKCAISTTWLLGFRKGTGHSTQGPSRLQARHELLSQKGPGRELAPLPTRHFGIFRIFRGLRQVGSGRAEIMARPGSRAGVSEVHRSERGPIRAPAACPGCNPRRSKKIRRGHNSDPQWFGAGSGVLGGPLLFGLGVIRFEPPGRCRE